jgi:uncharacterized protein YjaG (DUF416 family)
VALAAAIAEHWLPAYESFSADEGWGDTASMRRSLEAVWGHVQGRMLAERDLLRHIEQLEEIIPSNLQGGCPSTPQSTKDLAITPF